MITAKLINVTTELEEFEELFTVAYGANVFDAMARAESSQVEIISEVVDGHCDVKLQDGTILSALSTYHLKGLPR